jgi:Domain of unknown function (DUF4124)
MKNAPFLITTVLTCLLAAGAGAQTKVYETRDAEGNASFSDESVPGSKTIEIQPTDVVEAPQPMPQEEEKDAVSKAPGEASRQYDEESTTHFYGDDDNIDDPRLRQRADVDAVDDALEPGVGPVSDEERRDEAVMHDGSGEGPVERDDAAAERSDITGPDAEYRNTERTSPHVAPHAGGRR